MPPVYQSLTSMRQEASSLRRLAENTGLISPDYAAAASIDGASEGYTVRRTILPLFSSTLVFLGLIAILLVAQWSFPLIDILTGGEGSTMTVIPATFPVDHTEQHQMTARKKGFVTLGRPTVAHIIMFALAAVSVFPIVWLFATAFASPSGLLTAASAPDMYSRAEVRRQTGRYQAAITPPIEHWVPRISAADSADIEDATRALVEFDTFAQRELGTESPALGPMSAILLRTESASSSQIEQLTTSDKQIALAEIGEGQNANALTVIGNVRAMEAALQLANDLSETSILTIHPFPDGNGRTGRALAQSIIRNKGVVGSTTAPISAGLLTRLEHYFAALNAFRDGDAGPIVREFASASRTAAFSGRKLVTQLAHELAESRQALTGVRSDAAAWKVLPTLIGQPVVNTRYLMTALGLGEMAALRALETLTSRGVVVETTSIARGRIWEHRGILRALDGYAAEIRRMSK